MKLSIKLAVFAATACLFNVGSVRASSNPSIELTYLNSQMQCSSNSSQLNIVVDVYHNGILLAQDLAKGESLLVPSLQGLTMNYEAIGGGCLTTPTELHLTQNDPIPSLPGAYSQDSITTLLGDLNQYEDLYLVELGTNDNNSFAYDLQDVVFVVNNNPTLALDNGNGGVSNYAD